MSYKCYLCNTETTKEPREWVTIRKYTLGSSKPEIIRFCGRCYRIGVTEYFKEDEDTVEQVQIEREKVTV